MKKLLLMITILLAVLTVFISCTTVKPLKKLPPLTKKEMRLLSMMGGKVISNEIIAIGKVHINRRNKEVSFPGTVQLTADAIEVLITTKKGRTYETLLASDIEPYNLQLALLLSGAENGTRIKSKKNTIPQGDIINIYVKTKNSKPQPVTNWLINAHTNKPITKNQWVFVGSSFNSQKKCLAAKDGNIVTTWSFGNTILDNPSQTGDTDDYFIVNSKRVPKSNTPVTIIMRKQKK